MNKKSSLRLVGYLKHIIQAIGRIHEYIDSLTEADFIRNHRTQDAVIRNLEIVGEASNNVAKKYPDFAAEHPEVPWTVAYEMRNVLTHGYFKIDLPVVWRTIEKDLPELEEQVRQLLSGL